MSCIAEFVWWVAAVLPRRQHPEVSQGRWEHGSLRPDRPIDGGAGRGKLSRRRLLMHFIVGNSVDSAGEPIFYGSVYRLPCLSHTVCSGLWDCPNLPRPDQNRWESITKRRQVAVLQMIVRSYLTGPRYRSSQARVSLMKSFLGGM